MLEEIIRTIYFNKFKEHVRQELNNAGKFYPGYSTSITEIGSERSYLIRALKKLYNFIKNSVSIDLLFFIPNKISETKNRGEELIIIGRV